MVVIMPFTSSPLPTVRQLSYALVCPILSDNRLSEIWRREGDFAVWFSRSAWSMRVLVEWMAGILIDATNITVWLPEYFCNSSLVFLRDWGAQLVFYPLTHGFSPDWEWCRGYAESKRPNLFILVHYFGQPMPTTQAVEFCKDFGAWLVEDATHVLRPIPGVGEYGDCVLYSPHKHLAIPDGAVLVVRKNGPTNLGENSQFITKLNEVSASLIEGSKSSLRTNVIWLAKRIFQKLGFKRKKSRVPFGLDLEADIINAPDAQMSRFAKQLLASQFDSLETIAYLRQRNQQAWEKNIFSCQILSELLKPLPMQATPYMACFISEDSSMAKTIYDFFQKGGLPVSSWPDIPPEVLKDLKKFKFANMLRQTRIYFPLHQTLSCAQIRKALSKLNKKNVGLLN
jgi:dTDP-4-amino-4,6-dideoxygalactose transaminase